MTLNSGCFALTALDRRNQTRGKRAGLWEVCEQPTNGTRTAMTAKTFIKARGCATRQFHPFTHPIMSQNSPAAVTFPGGETHAKSALLVEECCLSQDSADRARTFTEGTRS